MNYAATLTRTGQITVPKWVREALGVEPRQRVTFRRENNAIVIEKEKTAGELGDEIRALVPESARKAYAQEHGGMTAGETREKWLKSAAAKARFMDMVRRGL